MWHGIYPLVAGDGIQAHNLLIGIQTHNLLIGILQT